MNIELRLGYQGTSFDDFDQNHETDSEYRQFLDLFPSHGQDEQLSNSIKKQWSFLNVSNKMILREMISEIPEDNRKQMIIFLSHFFTEKISSNQSEHGLRLIQYEIPAEERKDVTQLALLWFNKEMDFCDKCQILRTINAMNSDMRAYMIETTELVPLHDLNHDEVVKFLEVIFKLVSMDEGSRGDVLQCAKYLFTEEMSAVDKAKRFMAIVETDSEVTARVVRIIKESPPDQKTGTIGVMRALLIDLYDSDLPRNMMNQAINDVIKEVECLIKYVLLLFTEEMSVHQKMNLLSAICSLSVEEREGLIQPFCKALEEASIQHKLEYFGSLALMDSDKRAIFIEIVKLFPKSINTISEMKGFLSPLFDEVVNMDRNEVFDVIRLTKSLLTEPIDNILMSQFLECISVIPKKERDVFVQRVRRALPELMPYETHRDIMLVLYLLPDDVDLKDIGCKNPIRLPEYRTALITSLEQRLSQELPPSTRVRLANFIEKNMDALRLHEEHPMLQQAIESIAVIDVTGEKNPVNIYKKLKKLREVPEDFKPEEYIVDKITTAINMDGFRGISLQEVTREELPIDATFKAWNQLINALRTKMEGSEGFPGLPKKVVQVEEKDLEVVAPLWDEFGITWDSLWIGSLQDPYLSGLLGLSGSKVSLTEAKFRAVLSNILEKDPNPREDQVFTEQEEVLIKTAMSIQNCPGGKKEGIDGAYRGLEAKFHYQITLPEDIQKEEEKSRALEFVTVIVKNLISSQFSGNNAFMKEVTGEQGAEIKQLAHQSIYLKNLIGHLAGIDHEFVYDQYAGNLYDALIQKTRKEVLEIFFKYVTPDSMVKELMRAVNADLRKNSTIVNPLIQGDEFWDLDEEDLMTLSLNKRGAVKLLQDARFLSSL